MKSGFGVFFAVVIALGGSWVGLVVGPTLQLGTAKQTTVLVSGDLWPQQRTGEATLGMQVYRANGCAACHTEQMRQDGVSFDVVLTSPGKTPAVATAVSNVLATLKLNDLDKEEADAAAGKITDLGGKVETHLSATGTDIKRGWGVRHSVAADYLYDAPVQLGNLRAGPDLANVGGRLADANWHLNHLYAPGIVSGSRMPSFKFLFEVRKAGAKPSADALLNLPKEFAPADGYEVVPKPEAKELVAYLLSLRADVPLYEAPFTPVTTAKP
ncbi:MAG: cbb3-type cytochrome c oxidase subunit II [Verrucomicrobiae bacterium]|nr:cbb3-type cytochrome c oxidase subunit II [Verrucomicrobiae bacterium]